MSKRSDAIGFFWEDLPAVKKQAKVKVKRKPPQRVWEDPNYLPGLYEALAFKVEMFSDAELWNRRGTELILDVECYANYFEIGFKCPVTGKVLVFELSPWTGYKMDLGKLEWVLHNFTLVTFNGDHYDIPMATLALAGLSVTALKAASNLIIGDKSNDMEGTPAWQVLKSHKVKQLKQLDHVDLIEVCPLQGSLKKYAARLHVKRMQDLPFHPETLLTQDQMAITRWYNVNSDLPATVLIRNELDEQLALRVTLSQEYGVDLRSKSDAQIAEAVICAEMGRITGERPKPPRIEPGTTYRYKVPTFLKFQSDILNYALDVVRNTDLIVSEYGNIFLPEAIKALKLPIAHSVYKMGNGGLHSSESKISHSTDGTFELIDIDYDSFYPYIILRQGLYPSHLGSAFLRVYEAIVQRRLQAKANAKKCKEAGNKAQEAKWKVISDSLKITINGTFGKLGSMYSALYAPDLLSQVTISGQLILLMMIERMELACIPVISANTDGIVMRCPTDKIETLRAIVKQIEKELHFTTEETQYTFLGSRDVNSYMAVKKKDEDPKTKNKGEFAHHWKKPKDIFRFHKNPVNLICIEAIENWLVKRKPISQSIHECKDITRFVTVRDCKHPGAAKIDKDGNTVLYMGKMLRWYYAVGEEGEIVYVASGNKVARSEHAKPLMDLPEEFPSDIDYEWYINEAEDMLKSMGYV